jgi:hypothetical protein
VGGVHSGVVGRGSSGGGSGELVTNTRRFLEVEGTLNFELQAIRASALASPATSASTPTSAAPFSPPSSDSTSEMSTYTLTVNVERTYSQKLRSNGFKLCFAKYINGGYSVVWDAVEYVV